MQPAGHHLGQFFELADAHYSNDVGVAGDGVSLGHSFDRRHFLGQGGHPGRFGIDENKSSDHLAHGSAG
jgi:hypothetical protein